MCLASDECSSRAVALLEESAALGTRKAPYDLLSGQAGAIVALLSLRKLLDNDACLDLAVRLGDQIVAGAEVCRGAMSWSGESPTSLRHLTGFSHGAAGIGYALLELFHCTSDQKYRRAAEGAFRYERRWFDKEKGNWQDLREVPVRDRHRSAEAAYPVQWCHGAPGIALSRLRAYEILGDRVYLAEARTALATTRHSLEKSAQDGGANYSLCHGMAGNAEVLLVGSRALGKAGGSATRTAMEIGRAGFLRYTRSGLPWPCGSLGETPGLMLGLAGIGLFYLRLYDRDIPSVLMWRPDEVLARA